MFGSAALEVLVGLAFVYLALAIFCTSINEWLSGALSWRAAMLREGLRNLLGAGGAPDLLDRLYAHPLVKSISRGTSKPPSYLASRTFALVLIDLLSEGREGDTPAARLTSGIRAQQGDLSRLLLSLAHSGDDLPAIQRKMEQWFDDAMDRVSGWYKRRTLLSTMVIAAVLSVLLNADTVSVAERLWRDPALRTAVVNQASTRVAMAPPEYTEPLSPIPSAPIPGSAKSTDGLTGDENAVLGQLLGWTDGEWKAGPLAAAREHALGWILTIFATSLGAPFWFDVLKRISNVRAAGKAPSPAPGS